MILLILMPRVSLLSPFTRSLPIRYLIYYLKKSSDPHGDINEFIVLNNKYVSTILFFIFVCIFLASLILSNLCGSYCMARREDTKVNFLSSLACKNNHDNSYQE